MNRSTFVLAAFIAVLGTLLVGLGVNNWRMGRRVAALEMVVAQSLKSQGSAPTAANTDNQQAVQVAIEAWRAARSGGEDAMDEEEAAALVDAAIEKLEDKAKEKQDAEVQRYIEMAEEGIRVEVEDLQREYSLSDDQVAKTIDLSVQGMIEGWELQEDLKAGDLTVREAKEEGEVIKSEYMETLLEILGEAAFEALGQKFYPGKGWD